MNTHRYMHMEVAWDNFVKTPFIYLAHSLPAVHYCCLKYFISQRTLLGPNDTAYGHVCCSAYRLLWQKSRIFTRYKKHRREGLLVCRYDNLCVVFLYSSYAESFVQNDYIYSMCLPFFSVNCPLYVPVDVDVCSFTRSQRHSHQYYLSVLQERACAITVSCISLY